MNDSQDDFSPMLIDQQIDHPDAFLVQEDARLIHEMRALFEQEKSELIEQGWTRLASKRAEAEQRSEVLDLSAYRQRIERTSPVNTNTMLSTPIKGTHKKSWPRLLSLVAAVLVCVALVGSLTLVLVISKSRIPSTIVGSHNATSTTHAATPTATPLVIPPACKDTSDQADQVLCATGEETMLNITKSFTVSGHNPNGSLNGSGTVNVTFLRAYADPSRLLLAYTINQAPGTDWGGFATLSTNQGDLGSYGANLFKGFFVQSFDTSNLPVGTTQLHIQAIKTMFGASLPLAFTLPFHHASKTIPVKQTVTGNGYTLTLDHLVLTGSSTTLVYTYTNTPQAKNEHIDIKLQALTINGQSIPLSAGFSGTGSGNDTGGSGKFSLYQSFLAQPGNGTVTLALVRMNPDSSPMFTTLLTGKFTFTVHN